MSERTLNFKETEIKITDNIINFGGMHIAPAEVSKVTGLLGIVGRMVGLKALPPEVKNPPFVVEFDEEGNHKLLREGTPNNIIFDFAEIDNLIIILQNCLQVSLDIQQLAPTTRPRGGSAVAEVPDVFEGR